MDENRANFTADEMWSFSAHVISVKQPFYDHDRGWVIYVNSSLEIGDLFTFVAFRFMGIWNINDAYVVQDEDDGQTIYRFEVTPCQSNQP